MNGNNDALIGLYAGMVLDNNDPEHLARVRVTIPGVMDDSPWALPRGAGSAQWGGNDVPPNGADVYVMFVNGNAERPVYEPAWHMPGEQFPEHSSPDVHVWGRGPFRLVLEDSNVQHVMRLKAVLTIGNNEEDVAWLEFNADTQSIQLYADCAVGVEAGAIVNIDAPSVQVRGRKVMPTPKPIN